MDDRLHTFVSLLGAEPSGLQHSGTADFTLGGDMCGFVRLVGPRQQTARVSFVIALDADPTEVDEWLASAPAPTYGVLEAFESDEDTTLRLLVEMPSEGRDLLRRAVVRREALMYYDRWQMRRGTVGDMLRTLAEAGVPAPPLLGLGDDIRAIGAWNWGTVTYNPIGLYMFEVRRVLDEVLGGHEHFALCHAGHGVNSYGLNLVVSKGPIAAFVQHGYGGAYSDPVTSREHIAATYARLWSLFSGLAGLTGPPRWLLLYSEFRGVCSLIDLDAVRQGSDLRVAQQAVDGESALFREVSTRFPDVSFGFGGTVQW